MLESILSIKNKNKLTRIEKEMTTKVEPFNSLQFGHETFNISNLTSAKKFLILFITSYLSKYKIGKPSFAGVTGLEPATPGFGDRCSTN